VWETVKEAKTELEHGPSRRAHHTVCESQETLFFFGGESLDGGDSLAPNELDSFNTSTCVCVVLARYAIVPALTERSHTTETYTWSREVMQGYPPSARKNHSAELVGNQMYLFGGVGLDGVLCPPDMYILDLGTYLTSLPLSILSSCRHPHARGARGCV
jgi:hypothetical protein